MPVPTLPGTNLAAPLGFFKFLDYGGETVADLLVVITFLIATTYYSWLLYTCVRGRCTTKTCTACLASCVAHDQISTCVNVKCQHRLLKCKHCLRKCSNSLRAILAAAFIQGSRKLNVFFFPGLFTKHKGRHKDPTNRCTVTKGFILFLDRRVENNNEILLTFYFMALALFSSALLVFFRYTPVQISSECIERDDQDRSVFCYTIGSGSNLPVDCARYNSTELEEMQFLCYAISIPSVGVAIAAAGALAKLASVCITVYIRVSETVYIWSQENTRKKCANGLCVSYHLIVFSALLVVGLTSSLAIALIIQSRWATDEGRVSGRVYFAYAALPLLLFLSLLVIIIVLGKHCEQQEYTTFSNDQLPETMEHRHEYGDLASDIHKHEHSEDGEGDCPMPNVSTCGSHNITPAETQHLMEGVNGSMAYSSCT